MPALTTPIEELDGWQLTLPCDGAVAVLASHGQLAPLAWAFAQAAPGARLGYVQGFAGTAAGRERIVSELRERGLLAGHVAVGVGVDDAIDAQALTTAGALHHGLRVLGWHAAVCGPGPAPAGTGGGLVGLDAAHAALALGTPTLLVPRMSSDERRARHRGISHDTLTVLDLLLAPVTVALPAGLRSPVGAELHAGLGAVFGAPRRARPQLELDVERPARIARHDWHRAPVDLPAFAAGGLVVLQQDPGPLADPLFYGAALAAGTVLAELAAARGGTQDGEDARHEAERDAAA